MILFFPIVCPAWVAFALTYALLTFNILNREEIMSKIDWPFLLFMAAVIGISSITNYFGIAEVISQKLQNFTLLFGDSQGILFIFFVVFNIAIRFFLPIGATIALLIPIFISLAGLYTITAWAACFTCLIITDMWFFPYQCIFYTSMKTVFEEANVSFGEKKFLMFNALANIVRILAILASFYYWQWLGLL